MNDDAVIQSLRDVLESEAASVEITVPPKALRAASPEGASRTGEIRSRRLPGVVAAICAIALVGGLGTIGPITMEQTRHRELLVMPTVLPGGWRFSALATWEAFHFRRPERSQTFLNDQGHTVHLRATPTATGRADSVPRKMSSGFAFWLQAGWQVTVSQPSPDMDIDIEAFAKDLSPRGPNPGAGFRPPRGWRIATDQAPGSPQTVDAGSGVRIVHLSSATNLTFFATRPAIRPTVPSTARRLSGERSFWIHPLVAGAPDRFRVATLLFRQVGVVVMIVGNATPDALTELASRVEFADRTTWREEEQHLRRLSDNATQLSRVPLGPAAVTRHLSNSDKVITRCLRTASDVRCATDVDADLTMLGPRSWLVLTSRDLDPISWAGQRIIEWKSATGHDVLYEVPLDLPALIPSDLTRHQPIGRPRL